MQRDNLLVYIVGPTAVGKTATALELAAHFEGEIISADSRQFYREMSIGTAKPTSEELQKVPHHFIDSHSVKDEFNVADYEKQGRAIIDRLFRTKKILFVVGGSGLYLHALWTGLDDDLPGQNISLRRELNELVEKKGLEALIEKMDALDPQARNQVDINNPVRLMRAIEIVSQSKKSLAEYRQNSVRPLPYKQLKFGLNLDREKVYERINERVNKMMEEGLEEEARSLLPFADKNALKTVGYQELFRYFANEISRDEAIDKIKVNTRRYAKRQLTWFRRYEDIMWFAPDNIEEMKNRITETLNQDGCN